MKALHILATSALVLGVVAVANPASARPWSIRGFVARNEMTFTPPAPNGVGSELGVARSSGSPTTLAMATSGQELASISGSGSENRAAVTEFAARQTGSQVAAATVEPPIAGTLR